MLSDGSKTLLVHRNKRKIAQHFGKYNGLGGKMEPGEDIYICICREIYEEAGIICEEVRLRGTINWTGFGNGGENWFGFIFRIDKFSGIPKTQNEEGTLEWRKLTELESLPMWETGTFCRWSLMTVLLIHVFMTYENNRPVMLLQHSYHQFFIKREVNTLFFNILVLNLQDFYTILFKTLQLDYN